eukprot:CAMPEP_0201101984 /NCGR_PEP_ID=MMETSP0812-20130820/15569_1 /ASSEMBLY_ACC=CAM_ASM_000668 /TAXON_ID=98059 /ORGANISM="Dinobryon sp., Strain UTEXLB2267" /LENGTH=481 /DNA_ID=CAMNT_0047359265 /DNA_START=39 /DNA_END=1484 /DNA_ORIENTATION=-
MAFPEYVIGVILVIFGSLGNNLGNNLVSLAHEQNRETQVNEAKSKKNKNDAPELEKTTTVKDDNKNDIENSSPVEVTKPAHTDHRVLGTVIFIFGNLFTFASFGFGAQSLLASLESIQFVSNLFFAKYVHHEIVSFRMIMATLSIVGGNILVVIFADHAALLITSNQMIHLYVTNTIYHAYMIAAFLVYVLTTYIYLHYYHSRVILRRPLLWNHSFVEPFCYAASSAIVGTQAVLKSKCMALLIQVTLRGVQNEFASWYIYFILAIWLLLVSYWLNRLDKGLMMYPPLFIIPVMQVFFVFFAIICGGLYFQEFLAFSAIQFVGFTIGVVMILSGVYGLAPTNMVLKLPAEHDLDEDVQDVEKGETSQPLSIISNLNGTGKSLMSTFSMDSPTSPKVVCVSQAMDKDDDSSLGDGEDDEDKPVWEIKNKSRFSPMSHSIGSRSNDRTVAVSSPLVNDDCDVDSVSTLPVSANYSFDRKDGSY